MYPPATVFDFQPPWQFMVKRSGSGRASEAMPRVLFRIWSTQKCSHVFWHTVLLPTGCIVQQPFLYPTKNLPWLVYWGRNAKYFLIISTVSSPWIPPTVTINSLESFVLVFEICTWKTNSSSLIFSRSKLLYCKLQRCKLLSMQPGEIWIKIIWRHFRHILVSKNCLTSAPFRNLPILTF